MKRLRIAYLVPGFCADESDWCIPVLKNFVEHMAARHDVTVYTPHYPYSNTTYHLFGATVHCLSASKQRGIRRVLLWRELRRRMERDHARAPFDLVHAFWASEPGFLATAIARRLGVPAIVSIGGGELARFPSEGYGSQLSALQRFFVRRSLAGANVITAGSGWLARKIPAEFQEKVRVIPLGVDTALFTPAGAREHSHGGAPRLLVASSFIKLKDHGTILRAVALARRAFPDLTLDITADGVERPNIERAVRELGLADAARLLGDVRHERMPGLYRDHDLLLHASLYESQGMVILESLATGLPVVASNVGIAAELPADLVYRFEPRDAEGMADAIVRSLSSPDHARNAFARGPALVAGSYSLAGECDIFEGVMEGVVVNS